MNSESGPPKKASYASPRLTIYGDIRLLTQASKAMGKGDNPKTKTKTA